MAAILSDMEVRVLDRLEESRSAPVFWSLADEIRPFLIEAMCEATLIAGEPEVRGVSQAVTQSATAQAMPLGAIAILRMEDAAGNVIRKSTLWDMDRFFPSWENDTDVSLLGVTPQIKHWFPIGLGQWGVYPKQTSATTVTVSFIALPTLNPAGNAIYSRPYTGSEVIPFQVEYLEAFEEYAAHVARFKEGSVEFFDGIVEYDRFLSKMAELTRFADRIGVLRFSRSKGAQSPTSPVEVR